MNTKNELTITAIIPTYNRGSLIGRAIISALKQTRPPDEIIVVDDGSTDHTYSRVEPLIGLVDYIYQSNSGVSVARDQGVLKAKNEWITFLDSDDLWVETYLETMVQAIRATSGDAMLYFTDTIQPYQGGMQRLWQKIGFKIEKDLELISDATEWAMMRPQPMMLQSSVINRSAYLECGGFIDELQTREDTHLFLKLSLGGPVCAVAGVGTQMTADAEPHERLTASHNGDQPSGYRMQVIMFEDILSEARNLKPEIRHEFKRRLAAAQRRLARIAVQNKNFADAIVHLKESFTHDPATFVQQLIAFMMSQVRRAHSPVELDRRTK